MPPRGRKKRSEGSDAVPEGRSVGALGIQEAPVYHPTEEEFKDPLAYIKKIRVEAERYGVCRIVPPKGAWNPPFARDINTFSFPTKLQAIHHLQKRPATCDTKTFNLEYVRFLEKRGINASRKRSPVFQGHELDLCMLYHAVKRHGGFQKVVEEKKWPEVTRILDSTASSNVYFNSVLKQLYEKHLYDFEIYHQSNKRRKRDVKSEQGRKRKRRRGIKNVDNDDRNEVVEEEELGFCDFKGRTDQVCEQCRSGQHEEQMLLCDRCDKGWHIYCLSPPLNCIPAGNWYCLDCLNNEQDSFGFIPGQPYSLDAFRRYADRFKRKWFGSSKVSNTEIERRFWQIVEGSAGEVEVLYGSDLDTSIYGSGFPRSGDEIPDSVDNKLWKEYAESPWNLNNFPKLHGSMLRLVNQNIAGVMVPWLYIGMLFSSFCWHFEDHCFYSINYMHWGEPKCWYSVPGDSAEAFEGVMRKAFPDLFEAQPDLLFQLVTMLNPAVLKEKGVPVYTTMQEPGNFVITFPKSFHAGFNCGLNCAEAVNFAPADWLPHGRFAVELYRTYHKSAVLSHEELCCVVAKSGFGKDALPFLKKELHRIVNCERSHREQLWKKGIVKASLTGSRTSFKEEDLECVICRYYLHLSGVVCSCRPDASVCLQHAGHLCECSAEKQLLVYRYTVAELEDLLTFDEEQNNDQIVVPLDCRVRSRRVCAKKTCSQNLSSLKKHKGRTVSLANMAEEWISKTQNILQGAISQNEVVGALKEAEQFLWAGHEMDVVRSMVEELRKVQKWSQDVNDCLANIELCMDSKHTKSRKLSLASARELIAVNPILCVEPGLAKLKTFVEEASVLEQKITSSLSSTSPMKISELSELQLQARDSPFDMVVVQSLEEVIAYVKDWLRRAESCLSADVCDSSSSFVTDINTLHDLRTEAMKIHVELPQVELLEKLIQKIENWQGRAKEILKSSLSFEELEALIEEGQSWRISIPEVDLLRQRKLDTLAWIDHGRKVLKDAKKQICFGRAVEDLTRLLNEGRALRVEVSDIDIIEMELKKFIWREKASEALVRRLSIGALEELAAEISILQLEDDALATETYNTIKDAHCWEENAKNLIHYGGSSEDFNHLLRKADEIKSILPCYESIKEAISNADTWLRKAEPIFQISHGTYCESPLSLDVIKVLLDEAKLLKVFLKEQGTLRMISNNVEEWRSKALSLLSSTDLLLKNEKKWNKVYENDIERKKFKVEIEDLISQMQSFIEKGMLLGFELSEARKLKEIQMVLKWNMKALSFTTISPTVEDVQCLISDAKSLPITEEECKLLQHSLTNSKQWLKKALTFFPGSLPCKKRDMAEIEELLVEAQSLRICFPLKVMQIKDAVQKHKKWRNQVLGILDKKHSALSFSELMKLKDIGECSAITDSTFEKLSSKVLAMGSWISECKNLFGGFGLSLSHLEDILLQVKDSLHRAIRKLQAPNISTHEDCCLCDGKRRRKHGNLVSCDDCEDRFHPSCFGSLPNSASTNMYFRCRFCSVIRGEALSEVYNMASRKLRPTVGSLCTLWREAQSLTLWTKEIELVGGIVECASKWEFYIQEITNDYLLRRDSLSSFNKRQLIAALKTIETVELRGDESEKLFTALCIKSWRCKANTLIHGSVKPILKQVQQAMKEVAFLQSISNDRYFQELKKMEYKTSQWVTRAKQVVEDDGAMELDGVYRLIAEGENLPIDVNKELEDLKARSILYCICRKPYDVGRAMIACDRCSEWYHFDCINLPEPEYKDDQAESVEKECNIAGEFICPACCPSVTHESSGHDIKTEGIHSNFTSEEGFQQTDRITPPFEYIKARRRSKLTGRARYSLHQRLKAQIDSLDNTSSTYKDGAESESQSVIDNSITTSGRPCRRTAGQHSKFESYLLLTNSR